MSPRGMNEGECGHGVNGMAWQSMARMGLGSGLGLEEDKDPLLDVAP